MAQRTQTAPTRAQMVSEYDRWIDSLGLPIHRGFYLEDARTVAVGNWKERECKTAFLQLAGQEGVTEARITEIDPGQTLPPLRFAFDEIVYVLEGSGLTTLRASEDGPQVTVEWQKHSLFLLPRNCAHQLANARGDRPARLLHFNYLPSAMGVFPEPDFFFENPYRGSRDPARAEEGFYSEAKRIGSDDPRARGVTAFWRGNFFPSIHVWDKLDPQRNRGAGAIRLWIHYPGTTMKNHMAVFPAGTYKKAHRHGPGIVIVVPGGEGYSIMWPEGGEKTLVPWHEGSVFVPPNQWFHQHFNVGSQPARYLAFHTPPGTAGYDAERATDQIEYPDEDPMIRRTFQEELGRRGLASLMPDGAYRNRSFEWSYGAYEDGA